METLSICYFQHAEKISCSTHSPFICASGTDPQHLRWRAKGLSNKTAVSPHTDLFCCSFSSSRQWISSAGQSVSGCRMDSDRWPLTPCSRCFLPGKQVRTPTLTHFVIGACLRTYSHACTLTQTSCVHLLSAVIRKHGKCCSDR